MKTTIDIADELVKSSRKVVSREKITFRSLVEEGLTLALEKHSNTQSVMIKPVTMKGKGLSAEFRDSPWAEIRDAAYKGHGV